MNLDTHKEHSAKVRRNRQARKTVELITKKHGVAAANIGIEEAELLKAVMEARNEWLDASSNFEHAYEEKLIDYYTYKMKACEARYTYFIKKAKERGLTLALSKDLGAVYCSVDSKGFNRA